MSKNIFLYLRVSTQGQELENNRASLILKAENMNILEGNKRIWLEEKVTGKKHFKLRKLGDVLKDGKEGDFLIASEISRIGRNSLEIFEFFSLCSEKKIEVHFVKNDLKLDSTIASQMILNMYIFFSQIERELISARTKVGLEMAKEKGEKLGRPKGILSSKLDSKILDIKRSIDQGIKFNVIAKTYNVSSMTISKIIKRYDLKNKTYTDIEKDYNERMKIQKERKEKVAIKIQKRKENRINADKLKEQKLPKENN